MFQSLRYVWPFFICQSLAFSSVTQLIFSATIVGRQIGPEQWATLPVALLPIGTVLGVLPVTRLMAQLGRRLVFIISLLIMALANALCAYAINEESFLLLCVGSACIGAGLAALNQLRFAAMELVPLHLKASATSIVLFGGIIAALLGPEFGLQASEWFDIKFAGSYASMALVALLAIPFAWKAQHQPVPPQEKDSQRPVTELLKSPKFVCAVSAAAVGYSVMSFIMTATPISMHEHFNHSLTDTKWVIQSHILSMFLPSLFSGWLIAKLGLRAMMTAGLLTYIICIAIAFMDQAFFGFLTALILLGIGWNFLFVSGTVLLPQTHTEAERFTAQGFNDSIVFGVQAMMSISAGLLLSLLGWKWMLLSTLPLIAWQFYVLQKDHA